MKFRVTRDELYEKMSRVNSVVARKDASPVLTMVRMDISADGSMLSGSDDIMSFQEVLIADVDTPGVVCVAAKKLLDITKELNGLLNVDYNGKSLRIKSGRSNITVPCFPVDDFPAMPVVSPNVVLPIEAATLRSMMASTLYAVASGTQKFTLQGLCLNIEGNKLDMVGSDSHRMAVDTIETTLDMPARFRAIAPKLAMLTLSKLMPEDGRIVLTIDDNHMLASWDSASFYSSLMSGMYPEYARLCTLDLPFRIECKRHELLSAVRRVAAMGDSRHMVFDLEPDVIHITCTDPDYGSVEVDVSAVYSGEPMMVAFMPRPMMEAISSMASEDVEINMAGPTSPALITSKKDGGHINMIMPVRM